MQNLYSLYSQLKGNSWHLGSSSHTSTSLMFCPWKNRSRVWELPACAKCIPLNLLDIEWFVLFLRTKTKQKALLLLLTWIYFCRLRETVNLILPFISNVTLAISVYFLFLSSNIRGVLSHSLNNMPENVVGTCKLRNGKKRKETKRNGKKKNEKKTRRKATKKNETQKKRKQNSEKKNETKEKEKKRKNVKKRNEMKSTEARR